MKADTWITACGESGQCVEVRMSAFEDLVFITTTSERDERRILTATVAEWNDFLAAAKLGVFD